MRHWLAISLIVVAAFLLGFVLMGYASPYMALAFMSGLSGCW